MVRHNQLLRTQSRIVLALLLLTFALGAALAPAQEISTPAFSGKSFDVVSIRQNISQGGSRSLKLTPGPSGFQVTRMPVLLVLMTAYTPSAGGMFLNNIDNLPDWARRDTYDIDARISDADRASWNDPKNQPAMLQQMLQAMLADRFRLAVHRTQKEIPVYNLVVAKGGPKFTETDPTAPLPAGMTLPGGGIIVTSSSGPHFSNFSMGLLATALSENSSRPVVDKTGLTGRYEIILPNPARADPADGAPPRDPEAERLEMVKTLGLRLEPAKEDVEFLVIDHVERPTEN